MADVPNFDDLPDQGVPNFDDLPDQAKPESQGGLIHAPAELASTIPQFLKLIGSEEGRAALWRGTKQEFENLIAPFKPYGDALAGRPITPEQEIEAGVAGAMLTMGTGTKFPFAKAVAPVLGEFNETVMGGAAARLDAYGRTGNPDGVKFDLPIAGTKPEPPIAPPRPANLKISPNYNIDERLADGGLDAFDVKDNKGEVVTSFYVDKTDPKNLKLDIFNSVGGANSIGVSGIRNLRDQLRAHYPNAETIGGFRTTGARPESRDMTISFGEPMRRSEAAQTGDPVIDMVINHPLTQTLIDRPIVDRSHTVPYMAGGSEPLERPTVYIDKNVPREQTVNGVTFDPADPWVVHENVEQTVMEILIKNGMEPQQAYRTAHFGWAEPAEQAWYRAHGIDQEAAEAQQAKWLPRIQHENATDVPSDLYSKPYPDSQPGRAHDEAIAEPPPTPGEMSLARDIIRNAPELQPRSAEPLLQQARNLGVIGPPKEMPPNESPAKVAQRAIPARRAPDDKITMTPAGEPIDAWQARFETWVDKIETTDDIKDLIRDSAGENNNFAQARVGTIPAEHIEKIAEAAGIDPAEIKESGLRSRLRNDDHVRMAEQLLLQVTKNFRDVAEEVATEATPENKIELTKALVRRDAVLEYVLGLRAEWGRTGNALQEILRTVKDEQSLTDFLRERGNGRTVEDMVDLARGVRARSNAVDDATAARMLTNQRGQPPGWFFWLWTQGLISGPITHTKYVGANALYAEMEHGLVTPIAGMIGAARKALGIGSDVDRVFLGEAAAAHYGAIAAVPDMLRAAGSSIWSGKKVPLAAERELYDMAIAAGEKPPKEVAKSIEFQQQRPEVFNNFYGRILGLPGDFAGSIHTGFKVLGYAAANRARAYRAAMGEGLKLTDQQFWERMNYHTENPSPESIKDSVYDAYKGTFMQPLGPNAAKFQMIAKAVPGLRWVFPFTHIPINLIKSSYEYTLGAFADSTMRDNLLGKSGQVAQDKAIARLVVGGVTMGYFVNKYLTGKATGDYPTDPKERKEWQAQGKPPNSIQIGGEWVSFDRLGPAGDLARFGADLGTIIHNYNGQDDNALGKAAHMTAHAAANALGDEVGFMSVRNIVDAIEDPVKGEKWLAWQGGSFLPYSSFFSQTASIHDPIMRETKSVLDGLKYRVPLLRETLPAKRNPITGEPVANPGYGGNPAFGILRASPVQNDPIVAEMSAADYHPTAPQHVVGHVKLSPEQYDRYAATAGPLAHEMLGRLIEEPGWSDLPPEVKKMEMKKAMAAARKAARDAIQAENPELIQRGIKNRVDRAGVQQ